uniref:BTB domain-containing protein n=1 Tax=Globodera rostochiensis TaxID=31243 RepID=A0A914GQA1_GLORO
MKRTRTQSPSSTDADRSRDKMYSQRGQILFRMPNFKTFVKRRERLVVVQSDTVDINGLPWTIGIATCKCEGEGATADPNCVHIGIGLRCLGDKTDMAWTCRAAYQFSVVSFKKSGECLLKRGELDSFNIFTPNHVSWYLGCAYTVEQLMDPKNGFYDEEEDTVTFKAEVVVEEPIGMAGVRYDNALLINGQLINVNKYLLAAHSKYFQTLFFGENAKESAEIQIDEVPDAIATFKKLIATMYPQNEELDDECVEGVLLLANRFLLDCVVNRCVDFLFKKSKKSAICKFRMAHQFGIIGLKDKTLENMTRQDFSGKAYFNNLSETNKLGVKEMEELQERHKELYESK